MSVYCLTPTGARPEGLALLGEYLSAQSYSGSLHWIVVDDCDPVTRVPRVRKGITIETIRPGWTWKPGMNTQFQMMAAGLERVPADAKLLVLEDDDVYLPKHIETVLSELERVELVGEATARYYNVATRRWKELKGSFHSALAATGCQGEALVLLRKICNGNLRRMLDVTLWKTFTGKKRLLRCHNVVGIKGLPGRPGIGVGHKDRFGVPDCTGVLGDWIGDLAENYSPFRRAA